jgi:hypothetical protein
MTCMQNGHSTGTAGDDCNTIKAAHFLICQAKLLPRFSLLHGPPVMYNVLLMVKVESIHLFTRAGTPPRSEKNEIHPSQMHR